MWVTAYDAAGEIGRVNLDRVSFLEAAGSGDSWRVVAHIGHSGSSIRATADLARDLPSKAAAMAEIGKMTSTAGRQVAQRRSS